MVIIQWKVMNNGAYDLTCSELSDTRSKTTELARAAKIDELVFLLLYHFSAFDIEYSNPAMNSFGIARAMTI